MNAEKPRQIAVRLLLARQKGDFIETLLEQTLAVEKLKPEDRRFLQEIAYGAVRWELTLDWLITQKVRARSPKPFVQNVLRLALYQMFWLDRVPDYAAVNESVEICKRQGLKAEAKFVNAVLRTYGREAESTRKTLESFRETNWPIGFSHPDWLCRRWQERWGREKTVHLLDWNNAPPMTYARVNALQGPSDRLEEIWTAEGVQFSRAFFQWAQRDAVFQLRSHPPFATLRSFQEGLFYVQDPSTLLAVEMLDAHQGEQILDLCAAPGGKTTCLAQRMENDGRILAQDLDPARLEIVRENARRLGISCISTEASAFPEGAAFDRVLVDVPCSNTGVMRRRVELRWRVTPEEITRLARTQLRILQNAARRVRPGGALVYSTCSLESEENQSVIREFLASNPNFVLEAERALTPMNDGVDGAYCARLCNSKPV